MTNILPNIVKNQPTIDAVPVVHGHWVEEVKDREWFYDVDFKCSNCKNELFVKTKYCPNCWAIMNESE